MRKFYALILIVFIVFPFLLSACSKSAPVPCRDILSAVMERESGLPAGRIYDMRAAEGNEEFMPERLLSALYGDGKSPSMRSCWLDIALFLPSSSHPCELAVILCDSDDTAADTSRLLLHRLDIIRTAKKDAESSDILDNASVTVIGNYVLFIISSDTQGALKAARKALY